MFKYWLEHIKFQFKRNENSFIEFISNEYTQNYFNESKKSKLIDYFVTHHPHVFTTKVTKKTLALMFGDQNYAQIQKFLDKIDFNFQEETHHTEAQNIFSQISSKAALYYHSYEAWLFFILLEGKYITLNIKDDSFKFNYDETLKIIKHSKLIDFYRNEENQRKILELCSEDNKKISRNLFLDISLKHNTVTQKGLIKI